MNLGAVTKKQLRVRWRTCEYTTKSNLLTLEPFLAVMP